VRIEKIGDHEGGAWRAICRGNVPSLAEQTKGNLNYWTGTEQKREVNSEKQRGSTKGGTLLAEQT